LKNAYALLGKQRFEYAVAFFLLAGRIADAVDICVKRLGDYQLAVVLARVYLGEGSELMEKVIKESMVGHALSIGDRWLLSMAYSMVGDKRNALYATFMPLNSFGIEGVMTQLLIDPGLVLLHEYLVKLYKGLRMDDFPRDIEWRVEMICGSARSYERIGCPALALRVLECDLLESATFVVDELNSDESANSKCAISCGIDWAESISSQPATSNGDGMDWGESVSAQPAGSYEMDWGEPVSSLSATSKGVGMDWGEPVSTQPAGSYEMDWGEPVASVGIDSEMAAEMLESKLEPENDFHVNQRVFDKICIQRNNLGSYKRLLAVKVIEVCVRVYSFRLYSILRMLFQSMVEC
jgi:hypothetical protein